MSSDSNSSLGPLNASDIDKALTEVTGPAASVFSLGLLATSAYFWWRCRCCLIAVLPVDIKSSSVKQTLSKPELSEHHSNHSLLLSEASRTVSVLPYTGISLE